MLTPPLCTPAIVLLISRLPFRGFTGLLLSASWIPRPGVVVAALYLLTALQPTLLHVCRHTFYRMPGLPFINRPGLLLSASGILRLAVVLAALYLLTVDADAHTVYARNRSHLHKKSPPTYCGGLILCY